MENQFDSDNEMEIDLKDLLLEVLGYWKLIVVVAALAAVIGFAVSEFMMVPEYESTSELYVLTKSTTITSLSDIQTSTSLTNDYIVVIKGRPVLEQVITNLGLDETYASLKGRVSVNNPSNSRLLDITVTDTDPAMAKRIADEIADVGAAFISQKLVQDPPEIVQYGYSDGEPVSPNVKKNTVLGGLVGAMLAIAIVALSYLFNDSILGPEDIEKKLGMHVLGTLPLEEAEDDGNRRAKKRKKKKEKQGQQGQKTA
jgi:capsular polysaccharide biosynthesis protein